MEILKSCPFEEPVGEYEIENDKPTMTNEEWFCQLSTEEKAKVFYDFRKGGRISWRINEILMDIHDVIMDGYEDITPLKAIEIWLKEEHRDEA